MVIKCSYTFQKTVNNNNNNSLISIAPYGRNFRGAVLTLKSHTRTVVQEGDDASQWGNGKFNPLPRPNPLTDHHQKL